MFKGSIRSPHQTDVWRGSDRCFEPVELRVERPVEGYDTAPDPKRKHTAPDPKGKHRPHETEITVPDPTLSQSEVGNVGTSCKQEGVFRRRFQESLSVEASRVTCLPLWLWDSPLKRIPWGGKGQFLSGEEHEEE